ncbi:MAG: disulfide bond formation protein B [Actinomycetota bacterium]|nr:disulfide bond formation protein B [Actinomycetota bacterium]
MSYDTISAIHDVFAVLALVALVGAVLMVAARFIPTVTSVRFLGALHKVQLPLAALVASTATLASLWFSEWNSEHWVPCRFCWFQRIFMYSSAVVLVIAALRKDRGAKWYVVPLASIGILLSFWHILIEHHVVEESTLCTSILSCSTPWRVSFGSIGNDGSPANWHSVTLAVMAFSGFAAILALLLTPEPLEAEEDGESAAG